ncbi:MAG: SulP family inorganic anion transporter [Nitrospiraceae bacterium]
MLDTRFIGDDLRAGLVVFLVALPLCLGVALASDAPLFSGILSGFVGGMVVTLVSRSRVGVSGPAAGLAVIVAAAVGQLGFEAFLLSVVIAGAIQLAAGFLRAGIIAHYFPSSVIKGMLAGIGVILVLKQIPHAMGYDSSWEGEMEFFQADGHNTFSELYYAAMALSPGALVIAALSLAVLLLWDRPVFKRSRTLRLFPGPLLVVVLGIVVNELYSVFVPAWHLTGNHLVNVPVANSLSGFLTQFTFPDFSQIANPAIYTTAITLAIIASLETLLSVEATDKLDPDHFVTPTNLELKAQGVGNIVAGLIGGIPITQVIVRSSANVDAGGKTRLASFIHGMLLLLCVTFIAGLLNRIPLSCLAAILLLTGYKLARAALFLGMYRLGFWQFVPFLVTVLGLVLTDMLTGIALGMLVAVFQILMYNYRMDPYTEHLGDGRVRIRLTEHMTFLNTACLKRVLRELPDGSLVTIDATATRIIDHDVREVLRDFATYARSAGIELELKGIRVET